MTYSVNPAIARIEAPPIMEAQSWVRPGARNRALLNLCQAVPSYPPAAEMQQEVARAASENGTSLYTDIFGLGELRGALARHMKEDYGGQIEADEVCITAGCNQAFAAALMALAEPGDNAIVPVPYFFNHTMWLAMNRIEARFIASPAENHMCPRPEDAARFIDGRTRAIVLCSPNNPTGAIYPPAVIGEFFDLAEAHGIALVIDETYKDFRGSAAAPHDLFSRPNWQKTFVQLYSFSKAYSMTGYRVGSIVAGAGFLAEIEKILDCMSICPAHISQRAALFALNSLHSWKRQTCTIMAERLAALRSAFEHPRLSYRLESSGAFFAYVRHPFAGETAKTVAMRLAGEHDVLCLPGSMFGEGQENHLRIAFANADLSDMAHLAERLLESQSRY